MAKMSDVARVAGVSVTTVSHVVNDTRAVRPQTRERVLAAIETTGFRRNALASALVNSRTRLIGLAVPTLVNPYFVGLCHAIERRASRRGYAVVFRDAHDDAVVENSIIESLLDWQVEGLIAAPAPGDAHPALDAALRQGTPVVLVDRHVASLACDQVAPENHDSARRLAAHLLELGHRDIGVLTGRVGLQSTDERLAGVRAAAEGIDGVRWRVLDGDSTPEGGYAATSALLADPDSRPSALISLNNAMTVGAMRAVRARGLGVPRDLALVGFDDFDWADAFEPRLTVIAQDVDAMGERVVDLLIARIEGSSAPPQVLRTPTEFRHRNSCGCTD